MDFTVAQTVVRGNLSRHLYQKFSQSIIEYCEVRITLPWIYWVCKIHHKSLRTKDANIYWRKISFSSLFAPRDGAMILNCFWVFPRIFRVFLVKYWQVLKSYDFLKFSFDCWCSHYSHIRPNLYIFLSRHFINNMAHFPYSDFILGRRW